jgi:hypothetical protein
MAKKNKEQLKTPTTVNEAVANLYAAFRGYESPKTLLDVCTGCCMDEKLEKEMRKLPLASLYRNHFYQYNDSAKSEIQPAEEIKYFIPRMFELFCEGVDLHHSTELYLDRLGRVPEGSYSEVERKALSDFALVFFAQGLKQMPYVEDGYFRNEDAFTILLMFDIGGCNIEPLLAHWLAQADEMATLHYAYATLWDFWLDGEEVGNAFAGDRPAFRETMKAWVMKSEHRQVFTQRILDCAMQLPPEMLSAKIGNCRTHKDVLDEVFQYVAE